MLARYIAIILGAIVALCACSPSYNWRTVALHSSASPTEQAPLVPLLWAMLPCKPDEATRTLAFPSGSESDAQGSTLSVHMMGCMADGNTFTIASASVANPAHLATTLQQWQRSTRMQIKAQQVSSLPPALTGIAGATAVQLVSSSQDAATLPRSAGLRLLGQGPDGKALTVHALWFAKGSQLFQAAAYVPGDAKSLPADALESFFSGLRLP